MIKDLCLEGGLRIAEEVFKILRGWAVWNHCEFEHLYPPVEDGDELFVGGGRSLFFCRDQQLLLELSLDVSDARPTAKYRQYVSTLFLHQRFQFGDQSRFVTLVCRSILV